MENNKTVIVLAGLRVKQPFCEEFIERARAVVDSTRKEPGCLRYDLVRDAFAPDAFYFIEEYADDAAFAAHRAMPYMDPFRQYRASVVAEYLGVSTLRRESTR